MRHPQGGVRRGRPLVVARSSQAESRQGRVFAAEAATHEPGRSPGAMPRTREPDARQTRAKTARQARTIQSPCASQGRGCRPGAPQEALHAARSTRFEESAETPGRGRSPRQHPAQVLVPPARNQERRTRSRPRNGFLERPGLRLPHLGERQSAEHSSPSASGHPSSGRSAQQYRRGAARRRWDAFQWKNDRTSAHRAFSPGEPPAGWLG